MFYISILVRAIEIYLISGMIVSFIRALIEFYMIFLIWEDSFISALISATNEFFVFMGMIMFYIPKLLFRKIRQAPSVIFYIWCRVRAG